MAAVSEIPGRRSAVVVVIRLGSHALSLAYLHGHGPADNVLAGEVLEAEAESVAFHEPLALAIAQYPALAAAYLGDEAARAVDTGGMELHELGRRGRPASA